MNATNSKIKIPVASSLAPRKNGDAAPAREAAAWEGEWIRVISAAIGEAAPVSESASGKSKKTRQQNSSRLFEAIDLKNIKKLNEALSDGLDPNFVMRLKAGGYQPARTISPLGAAMYSRWLPGVNALIAHGADEGLTRKADLAQRPDSERAARELELKARDHVNWQTIEKAELIALVLSSQKDAEIRKMAALSAIGHGSVAEWLLDNGQASLLNEEQWRLAEKKALLRLAVFPKEKVEPGFRLLEKIWNALPWILDANREFRWGMAIVSNNPGFLRVLTRKKAPAPQNAMAEMVQSCFPGFNNGELPKPLAVEHQQADYDEAEIGLAENDPSLFVPLWAAAIGGQAPASLKTLGKIDGLARAALAHPNTMLVVSHCSDLATMKEAKRQGLPLRECRDEKGRTPAHRVFASPWITLNAMREWALLCPEWLSVKARGTGTPIDLVRRAVEAADRAAKAHGGVKALVSEKIELEKKLAELEAIALKTVVVANDTENKAKNVLGQARDVVARKTASRRL